MLLLLPYKSNNNHGNYKALNICPQALDKDILEAHVLIVHIKNLLIKIDILCIIIIDLVKDIQILEKKIAMETN